MNLHDFWYDLPQELIAQHPLEDRTSSRLLMMNKDTGELSHGTFRDVIDKMDKGDCLVLNNTKVLPARLYGVREDTGGEIEFLLLNRKSKTGEWEVILRPGKRGIPGRRFVFGNGELKAEVKEVLPDGNRIVQFEYDGIFEEVLDKLGEMPLPPYITEKLADKNRYQTVYAKEEGSAAAPTAGLHFTQAFLKEIEEKGINITYVTLHVGLGTFRPCKTENIEEHNMHSEWYSISKETADLINETKARGNRVIAVGSTSMRTLETAGKDGVIKPCSGETNIFIYPPYDFKIVDRVITNFHLPESTLIMLMSAFAGRENMLNAYKVAVENKYRFFSFGDAMMLY
ncbi:MAG: tRNA preQ1(34) S-adenosylmethionine ribosyltransferase-isomerase QueA [Eubacteriales bacterium]|nr:tRNA preQ1(34) S-adenosylmethionine ribosyltransferase-isomerase QueA [Eubacteriales bacterium]